MPRKSALQPPKGAPRAVTKAPAKPAAAPKKRAIERDESISGSDVESGESDDDFRGGSGSDQGSDESENEGETAAEKRLRLAQGTSRRHERRWNSMNMPSTRRRLTETCSPSGYRRTWPSPRARFTAAWPQS